jgi:hypothetical protein
MNAFALSTVAAAQTQIAKCAELLKKASKAERADEWKYISQALGCASAAEAWLNDALKLDEMTDGTEDDE